MINIIEISYNYGAGRAAWEATQQEMLANAVKIVKGAYPDAVSFDLTTSDQNTYGFVLTGVTLHDGSVASNADDDMYKLDEALFPHLGDLDWDGVVGEDRGGHATISLT